MDLKQLQKEFNDSWRALKGLLDQQQEVIDAQNELIVDLMETKDSHEEVLRELISKHY